MSLIFPYISPVIFDSVAYIIFDSVAYIYGCFIFCINYTLMFLLEWRDFSSAPCLAKKKKMKLDDNSRPNVVEIARIPDMLPSLFPSWSG